MVRQLGGSQISALLEAVPGIASVLRSPIADALVNMIRAGARVGEFYYEDAEELVQYSVRRGLIDAEEGDQLLHEVKGSARKKRRKPKPPPPAPKQARRNPFARKSVPVPQSPGAKQPTSKGKPAAQKAAHKKPAAKKKPAVKKKPATKKKPTAKKKPAAGKKKTIARSKRSKRR